MTRTKHFANWLAAAAIAVVGFSAHDRAQAETVYGITSDTNLAVFTTEDPSIVTLSAISGLQDGETILGIDLQPVTGDLFAVGSTTQLYKIDPETGSATQVGSASFEGDLNSTSSQTRFGADFDPVLDVLRFVSTEEDNLTLDPYGVAPPNEETDLNPPGAIVDIAYDRSFPGTNGTTLYGIDSDSDSLVTIDANGNISTVGVLGVDISTSSSIDYHGTSLYAVLNVGGENQLHLINPVNGNATLIGVVAVDLDLVSMAVLPDSLVVAGKKGPQPPKVKIKLNFSTPDKDAIKVAGALSIPDGFEVGGQIVTVDVGGVSRSFELDVKGKAAVNFDKFKLKVKSTKVNGVSTVLAQDAKFKLTLKKGNFAGKLSDEGLVNADISGLPVEVPVSVNLGDHFYQSKISLVYKAKLDKKGTAK